MTVSECHATIRCLVPRGLLVKFVERSRNDSRDRRLRPAVSHIAQLLRSDPQAAKIRLSGSVDGFISILQFIARDIAKDVHARRPARLSPLAQILTPIVSRHEFPPRVEPTFSRDHSLCFDF